MAEIRSTRLKRNNLKSQFMNAIEDPKSEHKNFVDEIVDNQKQLESTPVEQTVSEDEVETTVVEQPEDSEEIYQSRHYTLGTDTRKRLRVQARLARMTIQAYSDEAFKEFFSRQDPDRTKASEDEYEAFRHYEEKIGRREHYTIRVSEKKLEQLEYWSCFYAVALSTLVDYVLNKYMDGHEK